jgi:hypothetical protein
MRKGDNDNKIGENDMPMIVVTKTVMALALRLATICADMHGARRPVDRKTADAKLHGAAEVAHILGYGMTSWEVVITVDDWVRKNPRPVDNSAMKLSTKSWAAKVERDLAPVLLGIRRGH